MPAKRRRIKTMDRDEALKLLSGGPEGVTEWNRRRDTGEEITGAPGLAQTRRTFAAGAATSGTGRPYSLTPTGQNSISGWAKTLRRADHLLRRVRCKLCG